MSSCYRVSYLMKRANSSGEMLEAYISGNVKVLERGEDSRYLDPTNFDTIFTPHYNKDTNFIQYKIPGRFSCRESILYHASHHLKQINGLYTSPTLLVEYYYENGDLDKERVDMMMKIGKLFFSGRYSPIKVLLTPDNKNSVTVLYSWDKENSGELAEDLSKVSMLLYVFRNQEIMEEILDNFDEEDTYHAMYRFLAKEFLKHEYWSNAANPGLALSLFCYRVAENIMQRSMEFSVNGPSNLAMQISDATTMVQYLKEIYIPVKGKKLYINDNDFSSCSTNFQENLALLMNYIIREEGTGE